MGKKKNERCFRLIDGTLRSLIESCLGLLNLYVKNADRLDALEARVVALEKKPDPFQLLAGSPHRGTDERYDPLS